MKLSVVIPCFNEVGTIGRVIAAIRAVKIPTISQIEIIVVDDGSTDGTGTVLADLVHSVDRIIYHSQNRGKGACLRDGFARATGDIIIIQDADLEYVPQDYALMVAPIVNNRADVVFGSRFQGSAPHRVVYYWHRLGNGFLTVLSNMLTNINLTDMECCYKAFRRDIIQRLTIEENRFGVEPEITAKVAKMRCRIYEVGISYYGRTYQEGKKISWKDGIRAVVCILKYSLFRR